MYVATVPHFALPVGYLGCPTGSDGSGGYLGPGPVRDGRLHRGESPPDRKCWPTLAEPVGKDDRAVTGL